MKLMNIRQATLAAVTLCLASCSTMSGMHPNNPTNESFNRFYAELRKEAQRKGHDPKLLDQAFDGNIAPIPQVLKSEQAQPEIVRTFAQYTGSMLSASRIERGTANLKEHSEELNKAYERTGVPPSVIVALWGIETRFGEVQGTHPIIPALATLAWQSPRSDYFRKETFAALEVAKRTGKDPEKLLGSWAGAMGQCQFMPTSWLAYAQDGDGDGIADIWDNQADVFASAANYLYKRGWQKGQPWRYQLASNFNDKGLELNSRGLSPIHPLSFWKARGFKVPSDVTLPANTQLRYYKPQAEGPSYLLGPNFSVILSWNNSSYFAWSVLSLADTIEAEAKK